MTDKDHLLLAELQLQKAKEAINDASLMISNLRWNAAANRLYYGCFHAVTALLTKNNIETHTHAGTKQMFGLHFIKPGLIDPEIGRFYSELFSLRQASDYDYTTELHRENVEDLLLPAVNLIAEIEKLVKS